MASFPFWLNDDQDDRESGETVPALTPDYTQDQIRKVRDLEDFSRLDLYPGGLPEAIRHGKIQVGLQWKNTTGTPSLKIRRNLSPEGSLAYLTDDTVAAQHLGSPGLLEVHRKFHPREKDARKR